MPDGEAIGSVSIRCSPASPRKPSSSWFQEEGRFVSCFSWSTGESWYRLVCLGSRPTYFYELWPHFTPNMQASSLGWWQNGGPPPRSPIQVQIISKGKNTNGPSDSCFRNEETVPRSSWQNSSSRLIGQNAMMQLHQTIDCRETEAALTGLDLPQSTPGLEIASLSLVFLNVLSKEEDLARREVVTGLAPNHVHHPELGWMLEDPLGCSHSGPDERWRWLRIAADIQRTERIRCIFER